MLARICKRRASSVLHTCICLQISHRAAQRPHRTLDELTTQLVEGGRLKREAKLAALRLEQQQAELAEISISVNSNSQRGAWSEVCKFGILAQMSQCPLLQVQPRLRDIRAFLAKEREKQRLMEERRRQAGDTKPTPNVEEGLSLKSSFLYRSCRASRARAVRVHVFTTGTDARPVRALTPNFRQKRTKE